MTKIQKLGSLSRRIMLLALDAAFINIAFVLALQFRFDMQRVPTYVYYINLYAEYAWPVLTACGLGCFALCRLYSRLWEYAGVDELISLVFCSGLCMGAMLVLNEILYRAGAMARLFPRTVFPVAALLLILFAGGLRLMMILWGRMANPSAAGGHARRRVLVVGAGFAGAQVIREYISRRRATGRIVCVVDDDPAKANTRISGLKVTFGIDNIPELAEKHRVDDIIVAIPSATPDQMRRILGICTSTNCRVLMMPARKDVTEDSIHISNLRDISINDLLSREEVRLDAEVIRRYITDSVVLVTGGGGSIGSELCRQIARFQPKQLVIFDIYENNAYELQSELRLRYGDTLSVQVLIGSVRDMARLEAVFSECRPDVVFHAAAHKHVPLMEDSPAEAIKNNVGGTLNVARCADEFGVKRFVMISTDKAVNPTNVMGASKRIAELCVQEMARRSKTQFMMVRFGNVLGSNGSVIPLFKSQIAAGGPVTVTHPEITRYFMTIPEAAQLVLQAGAAEETGKIYVLDMGTPVKMVDLARNLIRLAGYKPDEDIKITYIGLRPGEKLYEELMRPEEQAGMTRTAHEKIFVAPPTELDETVFDGQIRALLDTAHNDPAAIRDAIRSVVPEYVETAGDR